MIELRKITEDNFRAIVNIKMPEDQRFVAPNVYSLAQAWLYPEARPFAIYNDDEPIGFIMLDWDEAERELGIWRLMIALEHQGKGYGSKAVTAAIDMGRQSGKFDAVFIDCVPQNVVGLHVYKKLGFVPTGEIEDGEIVMKLDL
ncbi:MAG: GNAT family N-acetyltransferase [Eubacteriales bacterium]|nr:GNAT family N-acetyltransferase [Eubacteriales bacterium]